MKSDVDTFSFHPRVFRFLDTFSSVLISVWYILDVVNIFNQKNYISDSKIFVF